ncbi:MAG TPA: hypothetical protein VFS49_03340 [Croceibacterium sp.]|nr:hypothetical protein [Croceibacterium sp.]
MATIPYSADADRGEAKFFFTMACVMAATIIAGFAFNLASGRSSFALPWLVHVHAWVMMGWVGLYLAQNALIFSGNVALHRKLGWLSVAWLPAMLVMGLLITRHSLQTTGGPPFFDQNQFLVSNSLQLVSLVAVAAAAVTVRRNTGWHRRLMYCAFAMLTGPGVGRLVPAVFLIPYAWYLTAILPAIVFPAIGMLADRRRYGRVHPAWFVGIGALIGMQVVADVVAYSSWGIAFTQDFIAGTPGAERPMGAFFPPM